MKVISKDKILLLLSIAILLGVTSPFIVGCGKDTKSITIKGAGQ